MCQHEPGTGRSPGTFIFIFLLLFQIFLLFMVILQVISEGLDICPFHVSLLILPPSLYTTQVSLSMCILLPWETGGPRWPPLVAYCMAPLEFPPQPFSSELFLPFFPSNKTFFCHPISPGHFSARGLTK